jgi:uncharacterized protein (DUF1697 family)
MNHAIFLRAVNVGGRSVSVKALAADLGLTNIQAAGSFVDRSGRDVATLRAQIAAAIPFPTELFVCSEGELRELAVADPFRDAEPGCKRYVTILASPASIRLPIDRPDGDWQVRVFGALGRFVWSLHRRRDAAKLEYPNELVERATGRPATTRNWDTIGKVITAFSTG